jgi:hypothetical protein
MTPDYLTEKIGTLNNDNLIGLDLEVIYALSGNDTLSTAESSVQVVIPVGGFGNDRYEAGNNIIYVIENGNSNNDVLVADAIDLNSTSSYILEIDERHILLGNVDLLNPQFVLLADWEKPENQIEKFIFNGTEYLYSNLVNTFRNLDNYLGNYTVDEVQTFVNGYLDIPDSLNEDIQNIFERAKELENSADDSQLALTDFLQDISQYIQDIRDFDGNDLGSAEFWKQIGSVDIQGDGDIEYIFVNPTIGRWASVGANSNNRINFSNHGEGGDTRVVGIYEDPLIATGEVIQGSDFDSQRRFQNDLSIDNLTLLTGDDYNNDGLQESYFRLRDGTAVLHAYMHADGNIQYANYQSESDLAAFMNANGIDSSVWADWF